jgi:hypothetical protein
MRLEVRAGSRVLLGASGVAGHVWIWLVAPLTVPNMAGRPAGPRRNDPLAVDPPRIVKDANLQMRAERDKRRAILPALGQPQSQIPTTEGDKQGAILRAGRNRPAATLSGEGESQAIDVLQAVHRQAAENAAQAAANAVAVAAEPDGLPTIAADGLPDELAGNDRARPAQVGD